MAEALLDDDAVESLRGDGHPAATLRELGEHESVVAPAPPALYGRSVWAVCAVVERHGMEFDPIRGVPGRVRPVEEANAVDRRGAAQFLEWLVG